jgi:hypothetical protein
MIATPAKNTPRYKSSLMATTIPARSSKELGNSQVLTLVSSLH